MMRRKTSRMVSARVQYLADLARFGLVRADELARARQLETLDAVKIAIAEEIL